MYLDILAGYINDLSDMNTLGNFIYGTQTSFPTNFTVNNNKVDQKKKNQICPKTCPLGYIMNYTDKLEQLLRKSHKIRKVKF